MGAATTRRDQQRRDAGNPRGAADITAQTVEEGTDAIVALGTI